MQLPESICKSCDWLCQNPFKPTEACFDGLEQAEAMAMLAQSDWRKEFPWADSVEEVWQEIDGDPRQE